MNKAFRFMDTSPKGVKEFMKACEEMTSSKYIIAEGKISSVLQTITASKMVYDIIEEAISGFNFSGALSQYVTNGNIFCPENTTEQVALVFCLLFAFDTRQTDLKQFLHTYFPSENPNDEFTAFCDKLIVPFANHVLKAVKEGGIISAKIPATAPNKKVETQVSNVKRERIAASTLELAAAVQENEILLPKEKEELLIIVHSLYKSAKGEDGEQLKLMFLSLKNTIKNSNAFPALSTSFNDLLESIFDAGISLE